MPRTCEDVKILYCPSQYLAYSSIPKQQKPRSHLSCQHYFREGESRNNVVFGVASASKWCPEVYPRICFCMGVCRT